MYDRDDMQQQQHFLEDNFMETYKFKIFLLLFARLYKSVWRMMIYKVILYNAVMKVSYRNDP